MTGKFAPGDLVEFRSSDPRCRWKPGVVDSTIPNSSDRHLRIRVGDVVCVVRETSRCRIVTAITTSTYAAPTS